MPTVKITDRLSVAGQPAAAEFGAIADAGFSSVLNLRPDAEEPGQPGTRAEKAAAEDAGLDYAFVPVTGPTITEADVRAFQQVVTDASGPVLAHCKSGTRALNLHAIGEVLDGRMGRDEVESFGQARGFDLSGAGRWLDREAERVPRVRGFFEPRSGSIQYVVSDPATGQCAIIDPVHDYDEKSGTTATGNADAILDYLAEEGLRVEWILDTHPHADHLSAASHLKARTGAPTAIGVRVKEVQALWRDIYGRPDLPADGAEWDRLFHDGDTFRVGNLEARVIYSPGHTLASITYVIGDAAFVHDTIFMPDSGTARADFPGGSAKQLWGSIQAILGLPEETRVFTGHDYQPAGRAPKWESTVGQEKRANAHLQLDEAGFIRTREARDRTLPMPRIILHALQVNAWGGRLPSPEADGRRYLRFPLDALDHVTW